MINKFETSLTVPGGFAGFTYDGVTTYYYNPTQMARLPLWLKDLMQNDVAARCEPMPPSRKTSAEPEQDSTDVISMAEWRRRHAG